MNTLLQSVYSSLNEEGFPITGGIDWAHAKERYLKRVESYEAWLKEGHAAQMGYLARGLEPKKNPSLLFPELKSILVVGFPYSTHPLGHEDQAVGPRYARYLRGRDYHLEIKERLERALEKFKTQLGYRTFVDTSAVLERTWAELSGVGWVGKNTMLLNPKYGSYFFLGVVFTDQEWDLNPTPHADYCGSCTRCLEGCPTQAFSKARSLDARKCISTWTLETKGELPLSEEEKKAMGNRIAGCDLCQEVCPFNLKAVKNEIPLSPLDESRELPFRMTWKELETETEELYKTRIQNSALSRIKYKDFKRNLCFLSPLSRKT